MKKDVADEIGNMIDRSFRGLKDVTVKRKWHSSPIKPKFIYR